MPMPPPLVARIRLRKNALALMAAAIGPDAYRDQRGGRMDSPNLAILTGDNRTGQATRALSRKHPPTDKTIATIGARYAAVTGLDFWEAVAALFEPVDGDGRPLRRRAAQAGDAPDRIAA